MVDPPKFRFWKGFAPSWYQEGSDESEGLRLTWTHPGLKEIWTVTQLLSVPFKYAPFICETGSPPRLCSQG